MALFSEQLIHDTAALVWRRQRALASALGQAQEPTPAPLDRHSPLFQSLALLIRVANGELTRERATLRLVEQALEHLLDVLLGSPAQTRVHIPDDFWDSEIGVVVSRARWWVSAEDLITISNAAALAFGQNTQANRMRIVRAIDSGLLDWVIDPSVANPQQNRRVLRPQVERLRDQRRLPE